MNTIEQAREVSQKYPELNMANYTVDDVSELNAWGLRAANTIDALLAELTKWQDADSKAGWINELRDHAKAGFEAVRELEALKALKGQEPVAWLRYDRFKAMTDVEKMSWIESGNADISEDYTIPVFLAAGAQPTWIDADIAKMHRLADALDSDEPAVCESKPPESEQQDELTGNGGAQERKGLFIDMIASHEGLAEEIAWERKPLTDDEIRLLVAKADQQAHFGEWNICFARAIEAAHGIKEQA